MPVYVEGLQAASRAFKHADRDARLGFRRLLRGVAEPIRRDAEVLAQSRITRIGPKWYRMRVGVTQNLVYVAPREKGTRGLGRGSEARRAADRKFAGMLMGRAMEPALETHEAETVAAMERLLDQLADDFNQGGVL